MNILIDIGHPAHVHLFCPLSKELLRRGHHLFYSVRELPIAIQLMEHYGMTPYLCLGQKHDSIFGKAQSILYQDIHLLHFVQKHRIDIGISSGIVLGHISQFSKMKALLFDDDDDAAEPLVVRYGHPFCHAVLTPNCIQRKTKRAVYYSGTHELAYLHPNHFVPNPSILEKAGLHEGERFFIMRFVALKGHHDIGQAGLSLDQKRTLISVLKPHGRVIITSERPVEEEFEPYRMPVPPEDIHSLMAYCSMFVGDSQTMTSEATILGVPALKCNTFAGRLSVPNMLEEKHELCYAYTPEHFTEMIQHIQQLLAKDPEILKNEWQTKRQRMLAEMIDPTEFFVNYIEQL